MAVLEEILGVTITVRVNGVDCVEYDDPEASDKQPTWPTSSKYIESPDDAEFSIHTTIDSNYDWGDQNHVLSVLHTVDNTWIRDSLVKSSRLENGKYEYDVSGKLTCSGESGHWNIHKLKFCTVNTEALQQEFIIPTTPPPQASLDGLSDAEVRRLAAERLTMINGEKPIKEENAIAAKRELSEVQDLTQDDRPTKIRRLSPEVIDLTDD
ncbi:hypothetical protein Hte_003654 [Hypoxylon texense]